VPASSQNEIDQAKYAAMARGQGPISLPAFGAAGMSPDQLGRANGPQTMSGSEAMAALGGKSGTIVNVGQNRWAPPGMSQFEADSRYDKGEGLRKYLNQATAGMSTGGGGALMLDPQQRAMLTASYGAIGKGYDDGDKLDLDRYTGIARANDASLQTGVAQRGATTAERGMADAERKTAWTMSPDRIREQAQLLAAQTLISKTAADGKSVDPALVGSTNDIINGITGQRGAGNQTPTPGGPNLNTPPNKDAVKPGSNAMGRLIADNPQLVHSLTNNKDMSATDKLTMLRQQKGSDWVTKNWESIKAALSENNPKAVESMMSGATSNPFSRAISAPSDTLSAMLDWAFKSKDGGSEAGGGNGTTTARRTLNNQQKPMLQRIGETFGATPSESDKTNDLLRFLAGKGYKPGG
jgi:hypothetical protein